MPAAAPLIEALNVTRLAPGTQIVLLADVSLAVLPGERLAVSGPSGAGKTLLLRALTLLDPLQGGEVLWRGQPIPAAAVPEYRRHVVYLHQRPALAEGTVEDNLRLPFGYRVYAGRKYDRAQAAKLFAEVDRPEAFLSRSSRDLSGGEAQLVAMVRALQLEPTVLLLDEPTASLDAAAVESLERLVNQWQREAAERAAVWVTHNVEQASRVANRIVRLSAGRMVNPSA